jgi:hypothetical protein
MEARSIIGTDAKSPIDFLREEFASQLELLHYRSRKLKLPKHRDLLFYFVMGDSLERAARLTGIRERSVRPWFRIFRQKLLFAAVHYPDKFFGLGDTLRDATRTSSLYELQDTRATGGSKIDVARRLTLLHTEQPWLTEDNKLLHVVEQYARALVLHEALMRFPYADWGSILERAIYRAYLEHQQSTMRISDSDRLSPSARDRYLQQSGIAPERHSPELLREFAQAFLCEYFAVLKLSPFSRAPQDDKSLLMQLEGLLKLPANRA